MNKVILSLLFALKREKRKDDIIMKKLTDVKDEINKIMRAYGYEVVAYCLDERSFNAARGRWSVATAPCRKPHDT